MRARLHFGFAVLSLLQLGSSPASASQENSTPESGDDSSLIRLGDLQQTQFASDIDSQSEVVPLFSSHGETTKYEPFADSPPLGDTRLDPLLGSPLGSLLAPLRNAESWTKQNAGLSWNIYYTLLYQHATRTNDGLGRDAGNGRLDINFDWVIFDEPGLGRGNIGFLLRSGVELGQSNDYAMGNAVGAAPVNLNALQWTYPASIDLLYWQQGWCEDRVVATVGKVHPNQYIQLSQVANDESRQFLAGAFDGLNTLGSTLGTYTAGAAIQAVPIDGLYINAMWADPDGGPDEGFGSLGDGSWWAAAQVGLTPVFEGLDGSDVTGNWNLVFAGTNRGVETSTLQTQTQGQSNGMGFGLLLQQGLTATSENSNEWSWGVMVEQGLTSDFDLLLQYGSSTDGMSAIDRQFNAAFRWDRPFGRRDEAIGAGFSWSRPTDLYEPGRREIMLFETYYRIQLTESMQLSPDLQVVLQPATGANRPVYVFGIRLKTQF
ncbi:carbohydrate porin [Phycisphaerales bacterium]|nr:carbohydrate porin [Phycisphaerales bacterium]